MKKSIIILLSVCLFGCCVKNIGARDQPATGIAAANGIEIFYESFGQEKEEAILLIMGTGAQLTAWPVELCRQLAQEGFRVIRFDNRDVGLSSKLDSLGTPEWAAIFPKIGTCEMTDLPYTLYDMAKDAVDLLTALKIERAHIVGASMGGAIAQLIAIHYPERVLSLTSIMASSGNPALPHGNPEVLKVMGTPPPASLDTVLLSDYLFDIYKAMSSPAYHTPDSVLLNVARESIRRAWYPEGTARHAAAVIIGDNCDRREKLRQINIPTVIIHGDADPVVNIAAARELESTIPDSRLITIAGMGHDLPAGLIPEIRNGILLAARTEK